MALPISSSSMSSPLALFWILARGRRSRVIRASVFTVLNKIFDLAPEILIGVAVDVVVRREQSWVAALGAQSPFSQILLLAGLTLLIWVGESLFEYLFQLDWKGLAQDIQHELRTQAYSHVQRLELSWFESRSPGTLAATLNDDVNQLERFLERGASDLLLVLSSVVLVGVTFFVMAPSVAALSVVPLPLIVWGAFAFQRKVDPLYRRVRDQAGKLAGRLGANLAGIATIQVESAEGREADRIVRESRSYQRANEPVIRVASAFTPLIRMAVLSGFLATLVWGGWLTLQGQLEVGTFSVLVFLTQRLLWPVTRLAETVDTYQRAGASARRIMALLEEPLPLIQEGRVPDRSVLLGDIELKNVVFSYRSGPNVLSGLNLKLEGGKTTAIVGSTGSGKSTIAKLLLRLYEPSGGVIAWGGVPINELDRASLRRSMGYVGQEVYLFEGSILENIKYGRPEASLEEVKEAARVAEADEFISRLPHGYETLLGERGLTLSGGQRQRLALARAVLKNPALLILDEATSAVDNETERLIQQSIERIARGRTVLQIAHRLSTVRRAHQIYLLESGNPAEQGTHDELVIRQGAYSSLWNLQTGL